LIQDFDIAGVYDPMVPDSECLKIITEILDKLELKDHMIKINHRKLLDAIYEICNVPSEKYRNISSAIDKLDKIGWDGVKKLILENEIDENTYDKIYSFMNQSGNLFDTMNLLKSNEKIKLNKKASEALNDLELVFKYCKILKITDRVRNKKI
jgi:histidyl-tRNA synthetase